MNKVVKTCLMTLLFLCVGHVVATADDRTGELKQGTLRGRIVDTEQLTLPGASLYIESLHTGVTSDINGFYTFSGIAPGKYSVRVTYVGYAPVEAEIEITEGKTVEKDFVLSEGVQLQEVVVGGTFHGQRKALSVQKSAMGVTNVVSADQVGKFPDSNIGDALKRISGINVQYDQGEARFGQVRGTSADLTSVTINGNRLPSAEGDTRNVQLDLIPADMVQTIEVSKVVTSDMDGDAIGGAINLVTKNTPYRQVFNITAGTGYTWVSGKMKWDLGATWGNRFLNDKLGIMLAASYQYAPGGSDNTEFEYDLDDDEVVLTKGEIRQYYVTRQRQSYSASFDYKFNANHRISFKGIYNLRHDWENRYRLTYKKLDSSASKQSVVLQTKAGTDDTKNARLEKQQTMDFTLDGEHMFGIVQMDWAASYSRATEDRPNERYAAVAIKGYDDWAASFVDVGGRHPYSTLALPSITNEDWEVDELTNEDQTITENEYKFKLNFELPLSKGKYGSKLRFGAKYTYKDKSREHTFYDYDEDVISDWQSNMSNQIREGFMAGDDRYPVGTPFITKTYLGSLSLTSSNGERNLEEESNSYDATEGIWAGYVRYDQSLGSKLDLTVGVRVEGTRLKTNGWLYQMDEDENESLTETGEYKHNYANFLPSILLKYKLGSDGNIRASYTKTLSRPKYSALIANKIINISDEEAEIGDPSIDPATSHNLDLSVDYYFKSIGLVSAGLFYKGVKNVNVEAIGYMTGTELGLGSSYADTNFEVTQNMNAYDARIWGIELAVQRDFGFIAPALKCLGFYGNYTYTHSSTRNYNEALEIEDGDDVKMAGSPEHTANVSLFFEKSGFNVRLSYNTASSFIDAMNTGSRELDRYYDKVNYLDLNASYTWGRKWKATVYAEAGNLLNQPLRYYLGNSDRTTQVEYYGVRVNAGIKLNF